MDILEKIFIVIAAAIIISYLPSFFEIDESATKVPVTRTYKFFNRIITVTKMDRKNNE